MRKEVCSCSVLGFAQSILNPRLDPGVPFTHQVSLVALTPPTHECAHGALRSATSHLPRLTGQEGAGLNLTLHTGGHQAGFPGMSHLQ